MTWSKVPGAQKYRAFVKLNGVWRKVGDTAGTSIVYPNVVSGTAYTYTVCCMDEDGAFVSAYSTAGWSRKFIAAPVLKTISSTSGGVKLTWAKSTGAAKYRVFVKVSGTWKKEADTASTSFVDRNVTSGKTYTYTVRCVSSDGKNNTSGYDTIGLTIKYKK